MVELIEKKDEKTGIKELVIDKRTLPHKPTNFKALKYARNLPPECNGCPFRPEADGGNGICPKYKNDVGLSLFDRGAGLESGDGSIRPGKVQVVSI